MMLPWERCIWLVAPLVLYISREYNIYIGGALRLRRGVMYSSGTVSRRLISKVKRRCIK